MVDIKNHIYPKNWRPVDSFTRNQVVSFVWPVLIWMGHSCNRINRYWRYLLLTSVTLVEHPLSFDVTQWTQQVATELGYVS
jgi:hypothetical protein